MRSGSCWFIPAPNCRHAAGPPNASPKWRDALASNGWQIAVTGSAAEAPLTGARRARCRRARDGSGRRTSLGALAALVARARLVVCNDTGISHIAAAMAPECRHRVRKRHAPLGAARSRASSRARGLACRAGLARFATVPTATNARST